MTVLQLADYIVRYYNSVGDIISNKKLNKILYYIQGWHFGYFKKEPLFDAVPQAWVHGPVYPEVYQQYKWDNNIKVNENECSPEVLKTIIDGFQISNNEIDFLNSLLIYYSKRSGAELEITTHMERPWLEARGELAPHESSTVEIPLDSIKSYFIERHKKATSE